MIVMNGRELKQGHFPDGTLSFKLPEDLVWDEEGQIIEWKYESDAELFSLICLKRWIDERMTTKVWLVLRYLPHARMDRTEDFFDVFTLKYFCQVINDLNFTQVCVLDPHSSVSTALLDRVVAVSPDNLIREALDRSEAEVVCFPDQGALKRYGKMIDNRIAVYCQKRRDWATGKILGLDLIDPGDDVRGRNILIVDDISSRGGTFYYTANKLLEAGAAKVSLYVTHCEDTIYQGEFYNELVKTGAVKKVYTTQSLLKEVKPGIEIVIHNPEKDSQ